MIAELLNLNTAVLGFSAAPSPLQPAWPSTHRALLPVAGKPVIVHLVEQLSAVGIRNVRIAGSIQQFAVRTRLGTGNEWGIKIRYSDLHGDDLFTQTLIEHDKCLYLLGDQMIAVKPALESLARTSPVMTAPGSCDFSSFWELSENGSSCRRLSNEFFGKAGEMISAAEFHQTSLNARDGDIVGLNLPGYVMGLRTHVGWDTFIHPRAKIEEGVTIGTQCHIGSDARIFAPSVIGDGSMIDTGVQLRNVSVLPNSYVGNRTALRDSIITPKGIFDLHGNFWRISDPAIVSRSRSNHSETTGLPEESLSEIESESAKSSPSGYLPTRKFLKRSTQG